MWVQKFGFLTAKQGLFIALSQIHYASSSVRLLPLKFRSASFVKFMSAFREMLENPPRCGFAVDVWALGCVLRTCIGGTTDDDLSVISESFSRAFPGHQPELRHLIMSMLLHQSDERLKAENIARHNYLLETSWFNTHSLLGTRKGKNKIDNHMLDNFEPFGLQPSQGHLPGSQNNQQKIRTGSDGSTLTTYATNYSKERHVLKDIGNVPLPRFLRSRSTSNLGESVLCESAISGHTVISERQAIPWKLSNDHDTDPHSLEHTVRPGGSTANTSSLVHHVAVSNIPIGTTRPLPIDTRSLSPKLHKLAMGTITILKSRSLLVDFRQNQRRLGLKGDQVIVISNQGTSIMIFHAPHLSVPTCLLEPIHQYNLDNLPSVYWKQYNDAANFVDRLRRKIPFVRSLVYVIISLTLRNRLSCINREQNVP
ncbi:hypothetical protein HYPSUDRAFT_67963 [Hypholoma sublateritium FD-334 SS-4]|uniref:Cryptic POLO box 1 (CPB1) domain-containing protein n=1 Tax=Hypholoma sublateritium (strain FD-334 SS-4) TaxID=945553 RepID=A0A0D2NXN3_HYPSF|nr:hypothetical protein HYPSUDRAFT_67963 [Hypholoma sublateritium FD-334 SS-4]